MDARKWEVGAAAMQEQQAVAKFRQCRISVPSTAAVPEVLFHTHPNIATAPMCAIVIMRSQPAGIQCTYPMSHYKEMNYFRLQPRNALGVPRVRIGFCVLGSELTKLLFCLHKPAAAHGQLLDQQAKKAAIGPRAAC